MKISPNELDGFELYEPDQLEQFAVVRPATGTYLEISPDKKSIEFSIACVPFDEINWNCNQDKTTHFFDMLKYSTKKGWTPIIITPKNFGDTSTPTLEKTIAELIEKQYPTLLKRGEPTLFHGTYDNDAGFIVANIRTTNPEEITEFSKRYLTFLIDEAQESIKQHEPNYKINIHALAHKLSAYLETKIDTASLLEQIEGFTEYEFDNRASTFIQNSNYVKAIVQPNGCAFTYNDALEAETQKIVEGKTDTIEKSKAIFEWIKTNIPYDHKKEKAFRIKYRTALQTYHDRKGVCGELAALQITMERLAGEKAFYATVDKDHACAAHICPNGKVLLVDPAQKTFDAQHKNFEIVSDEHTNAGYT